MVLQLVPVLSMLFLLTTAAGSALWANQLETGRVAIGISPPGDDEHVGRSAEQAPAYEDNYDDDNDDNPV